MPQGTDALVVLSGVTKGLGRAMAEEFIARGATVAGCGRSPEALGELKTKYPKHHWTEVDVTDAKQVKGWAERVLKELRAPDFLINNAAMMNPNAPLWEQSIEDFSKIVDVNIKGVFHLIRSFVPAMVSRKRGVIVNFSSGWGRSTSAEVAPYCATKFAIEGLTQAMAQELPAGMAAVPLNPGVIDTDMLRSSFGGGAGAYPKPKEWVKKAVPFILGFTAKDNGRSLSVPGSVED